MGCHVAVGGVGHVGVGWGGNYRVLNLHFSLGTNVIIMPS